jgi:hypothetical protein
MRTRAGSIQTYSLLFVSVGHSMTARKEIRLLLVLAT